MTPTANFDAPPDGCTDHGGELHHCWPRHALHDLNDREHWVTAHVPGALHLAIDFTRIAHAGIRHSSGHS